MSPDINNNKVTKPSFSSSEKTKKFIKELRDLLDKHDAQLYISSCELYLKDNGFVGYIEDNLETIEIVDNDGNILYTTQK